MLTRLRVSGFKNLLDVDVRFGATTCVTGPSGAGKSNLLSAIGMLGALATRPFAEAALEVCPDRLPGGLPVDMCFHRSGDSVSPAISFEAEILIPRHAIDELGRRADASITFVRYRVTLARNARATMGESPVVLLREELTPIAVSQARTSLLFPHTGEWRRSVLRGRRPSALISTDKEAGATVVLVHQDGTAGRPRVLRARGLHRTALSIADAVENPTAYVVRRELESWRRIDLESLAQARPPRPASSGVTSEPAGGLPALILRIAREMHAGTAGRRRREADFSAMSQELLGNVSSEVAELWVESAETGGPLLLRARLQDGTQLPASCLSDATRRLVALRAVACEAQKPGLICLDEPERGLGPDSLLAAHEVLARMGVDVARPGGIDNPLRQVVFVATAPGMVRCTDRENLIVARVGVLKARKHAVRCASFACLSGSWRANSGGAVAAAHETTPWLGVPGGSTGEAASGTDDVALPHADARSREPLPSPQVLLPFGGSG